LENTRKALACYETHFPLKDKKHLKFICFNPVICSYDEATAGLRAGEMLQMPLRVRLPSNWLAAKALTAIGYKRGKE